ncbi:MAG: glycosyltransferase family 2 protein [Bacteroidetes bacterium]|nr:glycosyltransferase family 2 protein [Bacteroidota bacterium]
MPQLSVVIITFNEEKNIGRCLESIQDIADDVVVVDSFSTDTTESICKKYNVNFIQHNWEGYSDTKNFANAQAKFDWVLSLDADEALSEDLKRSIIKIKEEKELKTYKFNRLTNYCGSWINHCGWYPDTKIRIFDRRMTKWEGIIHEKLMINSKQDAILLNGDCLHYSYYSLEQHYQQTEKFSTLAAQNMFEKGKKVSPLKMWMSPVVKFLSDYFLKLGFLDGAAGFTICRISAYTSFLKYKKLRKLNFKK